MMFKTYNFATTKMARTALLCLFFIGQLALQGQSKATSISNIYDMEPAQNHYKDQSQLRSEKREAYASMDEAVNLPQDFTRFTLVYSLSEPHYLTSSQIDFIVNSVRFPANSSEQTRAELDFLLKLQAERTAVQTERVLEIGSVGYWPALNVTKAHPKYEDNQEELFFMINEVDGEESTTSDYPKTTKLLKEVMHDTRLMEFAIKHTLLRVRPYRLDSKITPLVEIPTPSFASGHTLWAYSIAYVMSELAPEKRNDYLDLAYEIGLSREIMGVHYPSDEEVARQVSHRALMLMWHTEQFQQDFAEAQAEWKK